jgi:predicted nucleic acid-binding protein
MLNANPSGTTPLSRNKPKVCLDSTVFTALFRREVEKSEERWKVCRDLLIDAREGRIEAIVSALVLVECEGTPALPPNEVAGGVDPVTEFFESEFLTRANVDPFVGETARRLRTQMEQITALPPNQWLWLATALLIDADYLMTYDRKLARLNGQGALGKLQILAPERPWDAGQLSLVDLAGVMPDEDEKVTRRSVVI